MYEQKRLIKVPQKQRPAIKWTVDLLCDALDSLSLSRAASVVFLNASTCLSCIGYKLPVFSPSTHVVAGPATIRPQTVHVGVDVHEHSKSTDATVPVSWSSD